MSSAPPGHSAGAFVHAVGSKRGGKRPELTVMGASGSARASIELPSQIGTLTAT